jgi:tetratricopeptide (TPR) repeat protein
MSQTFDSLFHEGVRRMNDGDAAGAESAFRAAVARDPDISAAHVNLGLLLTRRAAWAEAGQHYRIALALAPHQVHAYLHYGALLAAQRRFAEAQTVYRHALAIDPQSPGALSNLGVLLACTGREGEAEDCYRAALAAAPGYGNASFNLAYLLLRQGRFGEGWPAFEARDWYARLERHFDFPRWHGEPLAGKTLIIGFEAGHGDMIQFCRYASRVKAHGAARVAIVCHPGLKLLFTRLDGVDQVFGFDDDVPRTGYDFWTPPLSFPLRFQTRVDTIPAALPYLHADPAKVAAFAPLAVGASGVRQLRVGLAWQGNPRFENDRDRSLPSLALLAPLGDVPGVHFFSLQKGAGALGAAAPPPFALTDLAPHIDTFDDTAAMIMQLDLVIAVDTAVAHLAGALNRPVWVLLPAFKTDWRWLTERQDSPWYPQAMRLFRQQRAGDWSGVAAALAAALQDMAGKHRAS